MSNEKIWPLFTTSKSLSAKLVWNISRIKLKFKGSSLKQENKAAFTPKSVVNVFIVYELDSWPRDLGSDFTLGGDLFEGLKLAKNVAPDNYVCSGYGIGFDTRIEYLLPEGSVGKKNLLLMELIWAHQCLLIIREKTC